MIGYLCRENSVIIDKSIIDMDKTLDCGQAFRWTKSGNEWQGVAFDKKLRLTLTEDSIVFNDTTKDDFLNIWYDYFDFDRDYDAIDVKFRKNEILNRASDYSKGIRILNQEPWETLCSFIISQNNNIPRIKGIIERLCENFGECRDGFYLFPKADTVAKLSIEDMSVLRSGFRAKYILDAAKKVSSGEINLPKLKEMSTYEARTELTKIYGVGEKVADCTLLFGLKHIDAFPKDVWIKKAMKVLFDGTLPSEAKGYDGIAQQYIFFYARSTKLDI